jgi:hypothetical protein
MVRRRLLIAQVVLLAVLAALALPSSGSALSAAFIELTPTGPSPAVLRIPTSLHPVWQNQDTVDHTVVFADGCSFQVAPGAIGGCPNGVPDVVGNYAYTVDGSAQASIDVIAEGRVVTLEARTHVIRRGSELMLHGTLAIAEQSPPSFNGPRQPVSVLARPAGHHAFHRIAVVIAKPIRAHVFPPYSVWQLRVRPRAHTTYIVEANSQPTRGQYWQNASSSPFSVRFRR